MWHLRGREINISSVLLGSPAGALGIKLTNYQQELKKRKKKLTQIKQLTCSTQTPETNSVMSNSQGCLELGLIKHLNKEQ